MHNDETTLPGCLRMVTLNAMRRIRAERFTFKLDWKPHPDFKKERVTDVDCATELYIREYLGTQFPGVPIIGEEDKTSWLAEAPQSYITVDPIDGTDAFVRMESGGYGPMIAFVTEGRVVAAVIGDVMSGETYVRDAIGRVLRYEGPQWDAPCVTLRADAGLSLKDQFVLCGLRESRYSPRFRQLISAPQDGGLFRDMNIDSGSIGLRTARLWKGSVGGMIMKPRIATPWDDTPTVGMTKALGYVYLRLENGRLELFDPGLLTFPARVDYDSLIIHESRIDELREWESA